ncbi:MAG: right-handed parallel beta-helix repeat-containing protein [Epsilonproteobacteria bacterium]|nr:right-handed parallel beta-helix repeat-containing protein [Campylobacterota bacterium]
MLKKSLLYLFLAIELFGGYCYSIRSETGLFTPVYPFNFKDNLNYTQPQCPLLNEKISRDSNISFVGCYKTFQDANDSLHRLDFNFKNPKIIKHKASFKDQYVIFPRPSSVKPKNIEKILSRYTPEKLLLKFPKRFYGNGIDFVDMSKITFMPTINLYSFYKYYKRHRFATKVMVLYNGTYSLRYLYKKISNRKIIDKLGKNRYILKTPIYVSPTAKLIFEDATVLLQTTPKPVFIMNHGDIYAKNTKFITWNSNTNSYDKREKIPENELLLIGLQKPRPCIIGLTGSKNYYIGNTFKGLGFHSTSATFGISLLHFPKDLIVKRFSLFSYLNSFGMPQGYYVGNTMVDNMMGFYCSESKNSALIGNLMHDNLIYNIDPHDYSNNLIIARNITARAKHAHGIVISRQVNNTIIAQNLTFNNHSAGIMLDRLSNNNLIYDNLSALNGYMGISVQESDNELIYKNKIIGNKIDGIIIRNSLRNSILKNSVIYNAKNGIEVMSKNIDGMIYRDFARDPYHKATSAYIKDNKIANNILNNLTAKNNAALYLQDNALKNRYYPNFGSELNIFTSQIEKNGGKFKLYGLGNPFRGKSIDLIRLNKQTVQEAVKIYIDSSCYNDYNQEILAKIRFSAQNDYQSAKREYIRGISQLHPNDMLSYGYFLLPKAKSKKEYIKALSYIAQSVIFGNSNAKIDIYQLIYAVPISKKDITKAFKIALDRVKSYKMTDEELSAKCRIDIRKKAKIESAWKLFEYNFKHSKAKNYLEYCKIEEKNFTIFTPSVIKKIIKLFKETNRPKKLYYKKLLKDNELIKDDPGCKQVSIRLKHINQSLLQYYNEDKKNIIRTIEPYIPTYLNKINRFRLDKIKKQKIYELLKDTP